MKWVLLTYVLFSPQQELSFWDKWPWSTTPEEVRIVTGRSITYDTKEECEAYASSSSQLLPRPGYKNVIVCVQGIVR